MGGRWAKDLSRKSKMPDPKLVSCGSCDMELLGESMAYLGEAAASIYGRPHVAGRLRDGARDVPLCKFCLHRENKAMLDEMIELGGEG